MAVVMVTLVIAAMQSKPKPRHPWWEKGAKK